MEQSYLLNNYRGRNLFIIKKEREKYNLYGKQKTKENSRST